MKSDTNVNYLADELQQRYDELTRFSDREFFLATADYIEFVIKSPGLQPILKLIDSDKAKPLRKTSDPELIKDTKLQATWASWGELKEIHSLIYKFRMKVGKLDPKKNFQKWFYTIAARDKLNEILERKSKPNNPFTRSEFLLHIGRVHRFIKEKLAIYDKGATSQPELRKFYVDGDKLFFRLKSGRLDFIDFSGAPTMWKVFKTFWDVWEETDSISIVQDDLVRKYKQLFGKDVMPHYLTEVISNIRGAKLKSKPHLAKRIVWRFDRKSKNWVFNIS